jgi:hypothetical protein
MDQQMSSTMSGMMVSADSMYALSAKQEALIQDAQGGVTNAAMAMRQAASPVCAVMSQSNQVTREDVFKKRATMFADKRGKKPEELEEEDRPPMVKKQTMMQMTRGLTSSLGAIASSYDASYWAGASWGLSMLLWSIGSSIVLVLMAEKYIFTIVPQDRKQYVEQYAVAAVEAEATWIFDAGMRAVDLLSASICTGGIMSSNDYGAMERAVAPAFVTGGPALRSVELSFSDNAELLVVSRRWSPSGEMWVNMQTTGPDCFLLGEMGCIGQRDADRGTRPYWYDDGFRLPLDRSSAKEKNGFGEAEKLVCYDGGRLEAYAWSKAPEAPPAFVE